MAALAAAVQVAAEGSGYSWAGNSREHQLTPWSNDPVSDRGGEAFYLRDHPEVLGAFRDRIRELCDSDPQGPRQR